jgi:hypothetical protein
MIDLWLLGLVEFDRDMHRELCGGATGLCPRMNPVEGSELLNYLRKVKFVGKWWW